MSSELGAGILCHSLMPRGRRLGLEDPDRAQAPAVATGVSCWRGVGAYLCDEDLPWDLESNYLRALEEGEARNWSVVKPGQPCRTGGGKPGELDILKPWLIYAA